MYERNEERNYYDEYMEWEDAPKEEYLKLLIENDHFIRPHAYRHRWWSRIVNWFRHFILSRT